MVIFLILSLVLHSSSNSNDRIVGEKIGVIVICNGGK